MLTIKIEQMERLEKVFEKTPRQVPIVASRAMNRAIASARTEASRGVRKIYNVKHGDVIGSIRIKNAYPSDLLAQMRSQDSPIPLMKFGPSQTPKGITVSVKKSGAKQVKSAFIISSARGGTNAFIRETSKRLPVKGLYGPSYPQMIGNEDIADRMEEKAQEVLDKRLEHELSYVLGGG